MFISNVSQSYEKLREKNKIINNTSTILAYHPKINKIS